MVLARIAGTMDDNSERCQGDEKYFNRREGRIRICVAKSSELIAG